MKERKDWCKMPYKVIQDERLNGSAKIIYAVLLDISNDWKVVRTITSITELTGVSPRQVLRALEQLREAGYIVSKRTDGRSLIIEIKPIELAGSKKKKQESEPVADQSEAQETQAQASEREENFEEALKKALAEKLPGKSQKYIDKKYSTMKAEASARVRDKSRVLGYLSKMIASLKYERDNSDGFHAEDYECLINRFD